MWIDIRLLIYLFYSFLSSFTAGVYGMQRLSVVRRGSAGLQDRRVRSGPIADLAVSVRECVLFPVRARDDVDMYTRGNSATRPRDNS